MILLTWNEVHALSVRCADELKSQLFSPDYVVGITMGGIIPAAMIAEQFKLKNFVTISAESYHDKVQGPLKVTYMPDIDLRGKRVLLIDEIVDTGATLEALVARMQERYQPAEMYTAALVVNVENARYRPDVWAQEVTEWVQFPWEPAA